MAEIKKRKIETPVRAPSSKIFSPFRVIGNVTNEIPFAIGTLGSTFYIVTSVGKSFQIYDANTLHLLFVSEKQTESKINCLYAHFHQVYAGFSNKVGIYKRGILEKQLELPVEEDVISITTFGEYLLATTARSVCVYKNLELYTTISVHMDIVDVVHLPTYLNKIVVVTKQQLLLYNIRTGKLVFTSDEFPEALTAVEVAPALDLIALGTVSGEVILYNVRRGRKVRSIKTPSRVSSLSFRTDGAAHLAVGGANGDLIFYDLDRRSRIHVLKSAHKSGISRVSFLNGQPILVTSGADNHLKEYVFDPSLSSSAGESVVQPPRHLRSRGGHSQPPSCLAFADEESHFILSGSRDRSLWGFSLRKDAQSQELSQRQHKTENRIGGSTIKEKFPEIISLAIENARAGEWENVITAHQGESFARTWDSRNKRVGRHTLKTVDDGLCKSVCISQCGNFGLVGSSNGGIGLYNLQSGLQRKRYMLHKKAVSGIAVDGMNRKMVTTGLDGVVGFFDFTNHKYLGRLRLNAPITLLCYHRSSDLFAVALDDLSIVVIDAVTQRVVRQLWGHSNRITALDFSPDGRWVVSASLDSTIRTWDLPTGSCIDGVKVDSVVTQLKFSPNGDFMATSHVSGNGISLWNNRAQFKTVSTRQINEEEFRKLLLPTAAGDGGVGILDGALEADDTDEATGLYHSVDQVSSDLITLSLGPRSKMNTLVHMEVIKQRSKPKEAPKKPEKAPFFLQLAGESVGDEASHREDAVRDTNAIREQMEAQRKEQEIQETLGKFKPGRVGFESNFTRKLRTAAEAQDYSEFVTELCTMSPAALDLEIRSLHGFEPFDEIKWFIDALTFGLTTNFNYELYEAMMNMLYKAHGDVIHANNQDPQIKEALENWQKVHTQANKLDDLVKFCSGVINFVTSS